MWIDFDWITQAHDKSVVEEPCSSGWCLKVQCSISALSQSFIIINKEKRITLDVVCITMNRMSKGGVSICNKRTKIEKTNFWSPLHLLSVFQILEGRDKNFGDDDFGIATERQCLQRPPSDNQERCAYVKQNHKRKFMCFCKGDLCNSANNNPPVSLLLLLVMPLIMLAH